jgi:N-hydroxyarylamine O-acetyltransferase
MAKSRLQQYLWRIGFEGQLIPTLVTLDALQRRHALNVPFENLDVQLGRTLTTDADTAFDKIVLDRRGGWCYEQNGLFGWALGEIGFEVTRISAAVMRDERGARALDTHLCLLIGVPEMPDRKFLADVGFGGSLLRAIELEAFEMTQPPFRLGMRRLDDGHWRFWEDDGGGEFSFDFLDAPADERALAKRCAYLQTDPSSRFVRNLVVQRRTAEEHVTLRGRVLTTLNSSGTHTDTLDSADELLDTLKHNFGLDVRQAADLWPRIVARHEAYLRERGTAHDHRE